MENGPIILSFPRRADEHISAMRSAGRRFIRRRRRSWFDASMFLAIVAGVILFFIIHYYRALVLVPLLHLPGTVDDGDVLLICLLPCVLAFVTMYWYVRRLGKLQMEAWRKRLGSDLPIKSP